MINQKMSRRFPGVLDDINYNGGSLYLAMFRSLKEQKKMKMLLKRLLRSSKNY